jgi:hypothetical protein
VGPATVPGGTVKYGLNRFKNIQFFPNFDGSKFELSIFQKIIIKYGFEDVEEMNNFLHRSFFRFGMSVK